MIKWTSNAKWTKISDSQDIHDTESEALAVCSILINDYTEGSPCPIRGVCLFAWHEMEDE